MLGQGGFGITYVAYDTKLAAKVAVKEYMPGELATRMDGTTVSVMSAARGDDFTYGAERFKEEARTLAKFMGQPNIAGVTDYFDENDTSYFVMDYIEGISFKTYIANAGGKVSVEEALNVMIPVLRALTAVHGEGFIHRDVTPDNIYITKDGNVKLLDFGSARYSIGDKSKSLDVILKVGYAPKEQYIRRGRQGPYTDVYSCAACLYAAITGYLPPESLERLDQDTLVPPSQAGAEIPEYLERAILKGLAVQPEDRFQTAAEFLDALENQRLVEVPAAPSAGSRGGENQNQPALEGESDGKSANGKPAKKRPLPLLVGGIAAAVILAVGIGYFAGGLGRTAGDPGADGAGGNAAVAESEKGDLAAEVNAPKITIAGEEYSTAATELDLTGKNLTDGDLIHLSQMTNLKILNLEENPGISDLTPLADLTGLEELYLPSPSAIQDLSPLARLGNLQRLTFTGNWNDGAQPTSSIQDFTPIAGLTKLTRLDLVVTNVSDLSFLSNLKELRILRFFGDVTSEDFTDLAELENLEELRFSGTGLQSVSGVENLTKLRSLKIYDNSDTLYMEDLSALAGLTELQELRLDASGLKSFHGIENMTGLQEAEFYGDDASFADVEPLRNLTSLQVLVMPMRSRECTAPYDGSALAALTNLTDLRMDRGIASLEPLRNLTNLRHLDARRGHAENMGYYDLEPLSGLTGLQSLELMLDGTSEPADLTPLSGLTNLTSLFISTQGIESSGPSVANLSALSGMKNLQNLELWARNLTDISPLGALTGLQTVSIQTYNRYGSGELTDVSALDHVPSVTIENR